MTGNPDAGATPEVIEVDNFDEAIDPNDAILNESGEVVQYFDREKNQTYVKKGSTPMTNADPAPAADPDKPADKGAAPAPKPDPDKPVEKPAAKDPKAEAANLADYILKKTGYSLDEVDLGDGNKVKIADLTPDQQLEIVTAEFDTMASNLGAKVKELEARKPELKFEDPNAQQLVDYLKNGGDIKKLAKEILSKDPAAQAKMMSDDDIVKAGIKKDFPEFSDEEVNEEFEDMKKNNSLARRAKAYRVRMEKETPDYSALTKEQQAAQAAAIAEEEATFTKERDFVAQKAKEIKEIAGIPVDEKMMNFLVKQVVPDNKDSDSKFVASLDKPERLFRLQFLDTYAEKLLDKTADHYFKLGIAEGSKGKEALSDEPVKTYTVGKKPKKNPTSIAEMDFDAFLNDAEF